MRSIALLALLAAAGFAQKPDQVKWSLALQPSAAAPGSKVQARLTGRIDPGWHMYSMTTAAAIPTTVRLAPEPAIESVKVYQTNPKRAFDPNFNQETETYEGEAVFLLELELAQNAKPGSVDVTAQVRYQTCNDKVCIPPVARTASAPLTIDPAAAAPALTIPSGFEEFKGKKPPPVKSESGAPFLLVAFGFGLAAIFTPCVFPMIPITMSFFLNRPSSVFQAAVFCLGIIVLFTGLGLAATAILGPFGVVQLGSNPWVNGFIALIFLAFGLSLLGAFEITIPSALLTSLNRQSEKGGIAGTLLMGLTFALASFACVGPFMGTLLAASIQDGGARPALGMLAFASGLALPFFLLALFPGYLKRMPKSGGWLARVKVVMGFVILAAMLKYLAAVDQVLQWNFLTRERFLAAWIVLFGMAGLYLLGFVPLEGIKKDERMGLGRLLTGMALLIFAISLAPGMSGARLGDLDAYVPVASAPVGGGDAGLVWMKNQFREALARAKAEGKLVLVNFTGYACTNCHWMKANMFTRPEVAAAMKDFILVDLYTDADDEASRQNQQLEQTKFSTIAIPYYAIFDANENVIATFPGLTKDSQEYLAFLAKGKIAPAPASESPLNATTLDGAPYPAASLQGKVVVVNFWATWCVPCIKEIPSFNRISKELAPKGVSFVGVSMDEDGAPLVRKFLKEHPIEYEVALGSETLGQRFQVNQLPTTVVLDRSGKAVKRFEGFTPVEELESAVRAVL